MAFHMNLGKTILLRKDGETLGHLTRYMQPAACWLWASHADIQHPKISDSEDSRCGWDLTDWVTNERPYS